MTCFLPIGMSLWVFSYFLSFIVPLLTFQSYTYTMSYTSFYWFFSCESTTELLLLFSSFKNCFNASYFLGIFIFLIAVQYQTDIFVRFILTLRYRPYQIPQLSLKDLFIKFLAFWRLYLLLQRTSSWQASLIFMSIQLQLHPQTKAGVCSLLLKSCPAIASCSSFGIQWLC